MQVLSSLLPGSIVALAAGALATPVWQHHPGPHGPDTLRPGSPESVGMLAAPLREMVTNISNYQKPADYQWYSGYEVHPIEPGVSVIGESFTRRYLLAFRKR